jgi:UDP-glucose 4-epimerase
LKGEPITVYDDGRQTRCFTYVGDAVEGTIRAASLRAAAGRVFNIGSDRETSVNELAELVRQLTGSESEIVHLPYSSAYGSDFEETRRRVPDVGRARELLGFEAETPFDEGLRRTLAWFEAGSTIGH